MTRWVTVVALAATLVGGCVGRIQDAANMEATAPVIGDNDAIVSAAPGPLPSGRDWRQAVISYGSLQTEVTDRERIAAWGKWLSERSPGQAASVHGTTGPVLTLTDSGGESFAITVLDTWTVGEGRFWDSGPSNPPSYSAWGIWSAVGEALLAPARLAAYVEGGDAWIAAHDRGMRAVLDEEQREMVAAWLRETTVTEFGSPAGPAVYPHLELVVNHVSVLTLARPGLGVSPLWAHQTAYYAQYDVPDGLHEFAASLFLPERIEQSSFRALFNADSVEVHVQGEKQWTVGPGSWRSDMLVRAFLEAVPLAAEDPPNELAMPDVIFIFQHGDSTVDVSIMGDVVSFSGRRYRLALPLDILMATLSAS